MCDHGGLLFPGDRGTMRKPFVQVKGDTGMRSSRGARTFGTVTVALLGIVALGAGFAGAASKRIVVAYGSERGGPGRVHVYGATAGVRRVLQSRGLGMDVAPSWAPNGRHLALATSDASGQDFDIAVVAANGSGRRKITEGPAWDEEPAWSPDGQWIAFASDRTGGFEIYIIRPNGTGLTQLTSNTCEDTEPSWSPDGSKIVFASRRGGFPHLWTMNADGTGERRLLKALSTSPAWSPDGNTIAYVSDAGGDSEIFTVGANGRGITQLTDNAAISDEGPSWSPDGSMVAFSSDRDGDSDIFRMNVDGSAVHVLTSGVWTDNAPAWRP